MITFLKTAKKQRGFSLIELLIVISIIGILAALIVPAFNTFNRRQSVRQAAKQLKADLRLTQNRAVSSIDNSAWGMRFTINGTAYQFSKFENTTNPNVWTEVLGSAKDRPLPNGISISVVPTPNPIVFERLTGIPTGAPGTPIGAAASISVAWASGSSITETVTISTEGNIE